MPDIALQTMLPKIDSPFEAQGKALQLRQMLQAGQEQDYQNQQRAQAQADDASYRQALQSSGGDSTRMLSALAGAGNYGGYAKAQAADLAQRKGNTDIAKDQATTQKTHFDVMKDANTMVGSAAGALKAKPSYENAVAIVGQLKQRLGPEISQQLGLDTLQIPNDPAAIAQWADQHYMAAIDAEKQMADMTKKQEGLADRQQQDMNSQRSAASSKYSADRTAGTAAARLAYDKTKDAGSEDSALGTMATRMIAQQYLAGDNTALGNIGRGTQGSKNLTAVRNEVARQANAQGMSGADIAAKMAEFGGMKAGSRTLGTRTANIEVAAAEAAELAPLALEASAKVARSGLLPFGKAQNMFDANTNNPDMREFAMANNALVNAFGQVMSRGGAATVSDKEHARELLSTAFDQPSYARAVSQLNKEIDAARKAPGKVRKEMSASASGRESAQGDGKVVDFGSLK